MSGLLAIVTGVALGAAVGAVATWAALGGRATPRAVTTRGPDPEAPGEVLRREIERARRYERRFVLVRLDPAVTARRGVSALEAIAPLLRTLDFAWVERTGIHILLPEVGHDEGVACVRRLREVLDGLNPDAATIVVFPDDAVTEGGLTHRLDGTGDLPAPSDLPAAAGSVGYPDLDAPRVS